jgi:hypothetical protein
VETIWEHVSKIKEGGDRAYFLISINFISFYHYSLIFFLITTSLFFLIIILLFSPSTHMNMKRHMDELLKTHMGTYIYEGNKRGRDEGIFS